MCRTYYEKSTLPIPEPIDCQRSRKCEHLTGKGIGAAHEAAERPPIRPVGRLAEPWLEAQKCFFPPPLLHVGANVSSIRYAYLQPRVLCDSNPCPVSIFCAHYIPSGTSGASGDSESNQHSCRYRMIPRTTSIGCFLDKTLTSIF